MNKKGFTLIELLGVILIISLLVIVVLPKITNSVNNFSNKTDKLIMNMIEDAAKLYIEDNSNKFIKKNGSNYCILISDLVNEDYLKAPIKYAGENIVNNKGLKVKYNNGFEYELTNLYKGSCTLVDYITKLYKETTTTTVNDIEYSLDTNHSLMNDRLGSLDVNKLEGNIRYYGANPNNYIDIGDRDSEGNIIFWRIIGLFKNIAVTDENDNVIGEENLVKIIRADKLTAGDVNAFPYDYKYDGINSSYNNVWSTSILNSILNNVYYSSGKISYYSERWTSVTEFGIVENTVNFESTGLSSLARNKIERVKWNLSDNSSGVAMFYADEAYNYDISSSNSWSGNIALMYISDYAYSTNLKECEDQLMGYGNCISTNWIYIPNVSQWTVTTNTTNGMDDVESVNNEGYVLGMNMPSFEYTVRPVMYLKSNISIVEEKQTINGLKYFVVD